MPTGANVSSEFSDEIVFFTTGDGGGIVRDVFDPIVAEARSRGYNATYSNDFNRNAKIGYYCEHNYVMPNVNSDLSIVTFHGIDDSIQRNYYMSEKWRQYDIGLLPGEAAAKRWQSVSWHPFSKPRMGVYRVGWPKSDHLYSNEFNATVKAEATERGVRSGSTILYAPTLESDNKALEFMNAVEGDFENILIKLGPYDDADLTELLGSHMNNDDLHILDNSMDIMTTLAMADIVVSDQSSVLVEAILTETIPVSVTDWPIQWGDSPSYPGKTLPEFAIQTTRNELQTSLQQIKQKSESYLSELQEQKQKHFDNLGSAAPTVIDLIEDCIQGLDRQLLSPFQGK